MSTVQPFQFEPERVETERNAEVIMGNESEEDQMNEEERIGRNSWCLCGCCLVMPTREESVCCKELRFLNQAVNSKLEHHIFSHTYYVCVLQRVTKGFIVTHLLSCSFFYFIFALASAS